MINKDSFYLQDIELLKLLQPIMAKKGIEADAWLIPPSDRNYETLICIPEFTEQWTTIRCYRTRDGDIEGCYDRLQELYKYNSDLIKTWRKDSLEAAIDWSTSKPTYLWLIENADAKNLLFAIASNVGQESLKALAQLIILLDKEGVE